MININTTLKNRGFILLAQQLLLGMVRLSSPDRGDVEQVNGAFPHKKYRDREVPQILSRRYRKHRIMYMSDRRLIRVTRIRLRTGYIFCRQIHVTRISPR